MSAVPKTTQLLLIPEIHHFCIACISVCMSEHAKILPTSVYVLIGCLLALLPSFS
jgi:hypothetical protein